MLHTNTEPAVPGLLGRVLDWVREHTRPGSDLSGFSRDELRHMATDLSLTESDLVALSDGRHDNTVLMEGMMRARGLDPDHVRQAFTSLLRDIERVCSRCRSVGRCRREMDAGTAGEHSHEFCPNADTFDDLIEFNAGR